MKEEVTVEELRNSYNKLNQAAKEFYEFNIGQTQAYKIKRKEHWVFNG